MSKKKSRTSQRARRDGAVQKAGVQDPKLKAAREARAADGTSRYAVVARTDATALSDADSDEEELDGATAAAELARLAQTCERVRRHRAAKAAEKAALLAHPPADEPVPSPLVPDQLSEPPVLNTARQREIKDKSVKRKRQRDNKQAEAAIKKLIETLGAERGVQALMAELRTPAMTKLRAADADRPDRARELSDGARGERGWARFEMQLPSQ